MKQLSYHFQLPSDDSSIYSKQKERFVIETGGKLDAVSWARIIFKKLKEKSIQTFEMHSYGLDNIAMCQEVYRNL